MHYLVVVALLLFVACGTPQASSGAVDQGLTRGDHHGLTGAFASTSGGRGGGGGMAPLAETLERVSDELERLAPRARELVEQGVKAYARGDYDDAERLLKDAIGVYPFLPEANLALGKIFLIRGSAKRDPALIENARLMFEMARALDPGHRETETLLELFKRRQAP